MKFRLSFLLLLMMLFVGVSCQEEANEETPPNQEETIAPNSTLANLMRNTSTLDGSVDNIIDGANCILVELPITVIVNGVTLTIETIDDYDAIEEIIDEFTNDQDEIEIQFPIVIILSDHTEVTIQNEEELEAYIDECFGENEADDDIECIDFVYPISISIYDANFQVIETVTIHSDAEMYEFISTLDGGVLASINYPINMTLPNGDIVEINNNTELEAALELAQTACDEDDDNDHNDDDVCEFNADIAQYWLYECPTEAYIHDASGNTMDIYQLEFLQNNEVIVNGDPTVTEVGFWEVSDSDNHVILTISGLNTFSLLNGEWVMSYCEENYLVFTQNTATGSVTMVLEMDCDRNNGPLGCLQAHSIERCDENNDGVEVFNLYEGLSEVDGCVITNPVAVSYHTSLMDAENNSNPIPSVTTFTNTSNPQTVYVRVEEMNNTSVYEIVEIDLYLEGCSAGNCTEQEVDSYLVECTWNVVQFNNGNDLSEFDLVFSGDGILTITGNGQTTTIANGWSTSTNGSGTVLTFSNIALGNIQAITGDWIVIECNTERIELVRGNEIMVIERTC